MGRDFLPRRDLDFLHWSTTFAKAVAEHGDAVGAPPDLVAGYQVLHAAFAEAYEVASLPATRTLVTVEQRRQARAAVADAARRLSGIIQRHPGLSDGQRIELGLTVPRDRRRAIAPPGERPTVFATVDPEGLGLRLFLDRRPDGAAMAAVYLHLHEGDDRPVDMATLPVAMTVSRTRLILPVPAGPATAASVSARWLSPRGQPGPMARAVTVHLPFRPVDPRDMAANRAAA
jgi:hypothetical protein